MLMTDANGHPLTLYYTKNTSFPANGDGSIATVTLRLDKGEAVPSDAWIRIR